MGLDIAQDGQILTYKLNNINWYFDLNSINIIFEIWDNEIKTNRVYNVIVTNEPTFLTNLKSKGISYCYTLLCQQLGVNTNIVPANMDSEVQ